MEKKTLFEIPIYSMSEKEFNKRWDKQKKSLYDTYISHGHSDEETRFNISNTCFPRSTWKYNQIVGYIKISVSRHDVWFDIFCSMDKKYYVDSTQKHFILHLPSNGTHFYCSNPQDDKIKRKITEYLKSIEDDHLKKIRKFLYVDYSTFDNVIEYVNIEQIMKAM